MRVIVNQSDITAAIADRLITLTLTDEVGTDSDTLEITLADHSPHIAIPPAGAEIEVMLGYEPSPTSMGLFVVDEIDVDGWPTQMTIRAKAAPFEASKGGKSDLQTQKSRSWPSGTTLSDMVAKIAQEHGMKPAVSDAIGQVSLPHTDQTDESDISMLVRIARRYDAVAKPAGGQIVLTQKGAGVSASGQTIRALPILASQVTRFSMSIAKRDGPGTVIAYWHDKRSAKREEVTVGSGDPVRRLRHWYQDAAAAKAAVNAEMGRRDRGEKKLSVTMPGNPAVLAETPIVTQGFRDGVNGNWVTTRATHRYSKAGGYSVELEAEQSKRTDG